MANEINIGDRVEVTSIQKGGFFIGRYQATVIYRISRNRIKVRDDMDGEYTVYFTNVKKLA
ncbi:hypothetical protein [Spirosoma endophyticum]|uniref:KOW motif-containing protein n=1 Tax=Spirosoma endophyticum TaxID=662367 RepID=A0A1I1WFL1_9BACT|nr:hypothetical protein [Spirosoma endophyticum]SFD91870.1 hypothetical protein SAMN05216167_108192 [Spirosoma endophyticum]